MNRYKPTPAQDWTELKGRQVDNIKLGSDQISDDLDRSELPIIHSVFLDHRLEPVILQDGLPNPI